MQNLFSHAHEPDYVAPQESVHREWSVVVAVSVEHAFDGFTDAIHLWWPVDEQSVYGEGSHVSLLQDVLLEESYEGDDAVWADVVTWNAPGHLVWHWRNPAELTGGREVDVGFEVLSPDMTRVTVTSEGLGGVSDGGDHGFTCDWSLILARYARFMGGAVGLD